MDQEQHRRVEQRAYALWQAEGQPDGRHEEHWQRAVREVEVEETASVGSKRAARRWKKPAA